MLDSSAGGRQPSPSSQSHGTPARHCGGTEGGGEEDKKKMEEKRGGEGILCCIAARVGKVQNSKQNDTNSKHHLSILVFLNWKANSNISSVGCGEGERVKVGKEATEISHPSISQTWSASSIRRSSMPL